MLLITVPVNFLIEKYLLKKGALVWLGEGFTDVDLSFLTFMVFIAVIAAIVQLVEMVVEKFSPALYNSLGIFLPLIAVNCAILGITVHAGEGIRQSGRGNSVLRIRSWRILAIFACSNTEKLKYSNVPDSLRGLEYYFHSYRTKEIAFMGFM